MRGREKFNRYKNVILIFSKLVRIFPKSIRLKLFYSLRKMQGKKGLVLRYILLKTITEKCGDNVSIHPDVYILHPENLSLGDNVSIHPMCYIECGDGKIEIGNDVSIAHAVTILAVTHNYSDTKELINNQGITVGKTVIEDNVWIGAKSTILINRRVESGAIVASNCVVSRDVKKNTIVGGIPNVVLKERN